MTQNKNVELIVAVTINSCIGKDNELPWRNLKDDMKFFRETTTGKAIIMGRNTFISLGNKPLPKRLNIVVSTTLESSDVHEDVIVCRTIAEAIKVANNHDMTPIVIGGGQLYEAALDFVDVIYLTVVDVELYGHTFFPELKINDWKQEVILMGERNDRNDFRFTTYKLKKVI